jgi:hypothetical protein
VAFVLALGGSRGLDSAYFEECKIPIWISEVAAFSDAYLWPFTFRSSLLF